MLVMRCALGVFLARRVERIRTTIAGVLASGAMLTGCAAETTLDTTDQGHAPAEHACAAGTETVETTATWAIIAACGVLAPGGTQVCIAHCPA